MKKTASKVLLIGWDAADWKVIHPLMDAGKMPALQWLVENGVMGNISTLHPVLSPMLWTSIASGKRPYKHGILGFHEPTPDGLNVQPITNLSRKTKAVWNILNQEDYRSLLIGWWPSHPAEPINGVMVSNHFQRAQNQIDQPWPVTPGSVHPVSLVNDLAELRVHPQELDGDAILPFITNAADIDQDKDPRLSSFAKILADCSTIHSVATHLMETEPWDFMAVYFDAIDHFSHAFMQFHPPKRDSVSEEDFAMFQNVVRGGYIYHDMMLRRLIELAGDDTTIIVMSDHGFHPDHLRPKAIPREPAGPAIEHRDLGIFVMKGPGIKRDHAVFGVSLLDITPTIITRFGLPVGHDMDGKPIIDAWEDPPDVKYIASWDEVPGTDGRHPANTQLDPFEAEAALEQLAELGYIDRVGDDRAKAVSNAVESLNFNLACSYMDGGRFNDALPLLTDLYVADPSQYRHGIQLAMCLKSLDRINDLARLVEQINVRRKNDAKWAARELEKFAAMGVRRAEDQAATGDVGSEIAASPAAEQVEGAKKDEVKPVAETVFDEQEITKINQLRSVARLNRFSMDFFGGYVAAAQGDTERALKLLQNAEKARPDRPSLHLQIGECFLKMKQWQLAHRSFETALEIDPENPHVHLGLARVYLARRENVNAIRSALKAIGLTFHYPQAHFVLAWALIRQRKFQRAVDALKVALNQNSNFPQAHRRLARIYRYVFKDFRLAEEHMRAADELISVGTKSPSMEIVTMIPENIDLSTVDHLQHLAADTDKLSTPGQPQMIPTIAVAKRSEDQPATIPAPQIVIVSGLPRSGTLMMMQMLGAGGLSLLTDDVREADEDNPQGFYEHAAVKQLHTGNRWLLDQDEKIIKVVAPMIPHLPAGPDYKVIFMDRDVEEIIGSQRKMLARQQADVDSIPLDRLRSILLRQRQTAIACLERCAIPWLLVRYPETVADPIDAAARVNEFLGRDLNIECMAATIDADLYRSRVPTSAAKS